MAFSKHIYKKAMQELKESRERVQAAVRLRDREICDKFPEVEEIEKRLARTGADAVKAIGLGQDARKFVEAIAKENALLQKKKKEILQKNGYPEDYLTAKYSCPVCDDTGYTPDGLCPCFEKRAKRIAAEEFNSSSPMQLTDFDSFRLDLYPEEFDSEAGFAPREMMSKNLNFCRNYAESFSPEKSPGLLMTGRTGLGKTHLSLAIAGKVIEKGYSVIYDTFPNIMDKAEREKFSSGRRSENLMEPLYNCDLLILDDVGAEFKTSFTVSQLYNIINNRMLNHLPTIINTNSDIEELRDLYGERTTSRLMTFIILLFAGKDIRQILRKY